MFNVRFILPDDIKSLKLHQQLCISATFGLHLLCIWTDLNSNCPGLVDLCRQSSPIMRPHFESQSRVTYVERMCKKKDLGLSSMGLVWGVQRCKPKNENDVAASCDTEKNHV